jgi:hypothetical protein
LSCLPQFELLKEVFDISRNYIENALYIEYAK